MLRFTSSISNEIVSSGRMRVEIEMFAIREMHLSFSELAQYWSRNTENDAFWLWPLNAHENLTNMASQSFFKFEKVGTDGAEEGAVAVVISRKIGIWKKRLTEIIYICLS